MFARVGTCPNVHVYTSLPGSTPQRHAAAIPVITLLQLVFYGFPYSLEANAERIPLIRLGALPSISVNYFMLSYPSTAFYIVRVCWQSLNEQQSKYSVTASVWQQCADFPPSFDYKYHYFILYINLFYSRLVLVISSDIV
jgi:hypothetical protein